MSSVKYDGCVNDTVVGKCAGLKRAVIILAGRDEVLSNFEVFSLGRIIVLCLGDSLHSSS